MLLELVLLVLAARCLAPEVSLFGPPRLRSNSVGFVALARYPVSSMSGHLAPTGSLRSRLKSSAAPPPAPPAPRSSLPHPGAGRSTDLVERHVWRRSFGPSNPDLEDGCVGPHFAIGCTDALGQTARLYRPCRSCWWCILQAKRRLQHRIMYAFQSDCPAPINPASCVFVTLTMPRPQSRHYQGPNCDPAFLSAWGRFVRSFLRAAWAPRWVRVFERQRDRTLHVHLIVDRSRLPTGYLPDVPAVSEFGSLRRWRAALTLNPDAAKFVRKVEGYGFGPNVHVRPIVTAWRYGSRPDRDGVGRQIAGYLAKYAVKSFKDPYVADNRQVEGSTLRLYGFSRSWPKQPKVHVPHCVDRTFDLAAIDGMRDWQHVYPRPGEARSLKQYNSMRSQPFKLLEADLSPVSHLVSALAEAQAEYARVYARSRYKVICPCGCGHTVEVSPGVDDTGALVDDLVAAAKQRLDTAYSRLRSSGARASKRAALDWWAARQAARPSLARPPAGVDLATGEVLEAVSPPG